MATEGSTQQASWPAVLRSAELREKIKTAKVLCVGAGGIGCELLKTLVCTGFEKIEVIDLDTIETSNLNRQFLFRKHHVGESKARTAAAVVRTFKPSAEIVAHQANVKEQRFGVDYISGFQLVLNGLDNLEARRHVNRLAMAAGVPLVESGTAGYLGQVTVHLKGHTECYECSPKPVPKSFPICTLRNTPDKPIHCVVWAKDLLFTRLFGKQDAISDLDDATGQAAATTDSVGDGEGAPVDEAAAKAAAAAAAAEEASVFLKRPEESTLQYAVRVFERVYTQDIERLAGMAELWKSRPPPTPLQLEQLFPGGDLEAVLSLADSSPRVTPSKALGLTNPNQLWSTADNARVFLRSIVHYLTHRQQELGQASFDKDDDVAVDFVTSASNLRATCYGIPTQAVFTAKGMAGNIIHAIATTNAIVAGAIVSEALKLLAGCTAAVRWHYLIEVGSKKLLQPSKPDGPKPGCMACGRAVLRLRCNTNSLTLGRLLSEVVKKQLAVVTPMLLCGSFMYEEGEGLEEDEVAQYQRMLGLPLSQLPGGGLHSGMLLNVADEAQAFNVDVALVHQEVFDEEQAPEGWLLEGAAPTAPPAQAAAAPPPAAGQQEQEAPSARRTRNALLSFKEASGGGPLELLSEEEEEAEVVLVDRLDTAPRPTGAGAAQLLTKRAREEDDQDGGQGVAAGAGKDGAGGAPPAKRAKQADGGAGQGGDGAIIILDDD